MSYEYAPVLPQLHRNLHFVPQARFPNAGEEQYAACIGRVIFYRFINPAIV